MSGCFNFITRLQKLLTGFPQTRSGQFGFEVQTLNLLNTSKMHFLENVFSLLFMHQQVSDI